MSILSFNPRTHEECDEPGSTFVTSFPCFNPRTHEECDHDIFRTKVIISSFNPRTHEECDPHTGRNLWNSSISFNPRTHEECDFASVPVQKLCNCFNPRTHEECDCLFRPKQTLLHKFQSTHSRGVRHPARLSGLVYIPGFNPRTHEECDTLSNGDTTVEIVSIHALTRSATKNDRSYFSYLMFQSTHSRGVRLSKRLLLYNGGSFNPRTHEECDP